MRKTAMSRRTVLEAGVCALAAAASIPEIASAHAQTGRSPKNAALIRKYYAGWEKKDWSSFNTLLTDNFTFSSPVDAPMSKSAFKKGCWDTQSPLIGHFDLEHVVGADNEAFVMYLCHTTKGKTFRNVEYFRLKGEQVEAVECYFGGQGYPSAVDGQK
jgi:ketosteroid isomerase-like protein